MGERDQEHLIQEGGLRRQEGAEVVPSAAAVLGKLAVAGERRRKPRLSEVGSVGRIDWMAE